MKQEKDQGVIVIAECEADVYEENTPFPLPYPHYLIKQ